MTSSGGLGIAPLVAILVSTAASAAAGKVLGPKMPKPPSYQETLTAQRQMEQEQKQKIILIAAGGVLLIFILGAFSR